MEGGCKKQWRSEEVSELESEADVYEAYTSAVDTVHFMVASCWCSDYSACCLSLIMFNVLVGTLVRDVCVQHHGVTLI